MVLYAAADLIFATRIKGTGEAVGVPCRPVRSVEMLEARLADSEVRALLLDLDAPELALELLGRLRGPGAGDTERGVRIVAWGPHVATDLLRQARAAGADEVMTRGAFTAGLPELLVRLEGGGG